MSAKHSLTEQPFYTIGIAGHIDHGKTTLTKALTGQNTDRLKEEIERNISIEPGFASFPLSNGSTVSIIDVPGHERFIRQMVAGVAGIDMVIMVIAADEGVMPQTKEHLNILQLLGVTKGVIALTKIDMADQDLIQLVEEQIEEETRGTFLEGAPVVQVDSISGKGIEELKRCIELSLANLPARPTTGIARLPIDRVFSKKGFGTIVTGTLYQGRLRIGDELILLPNNQKVKVRQLQVHGETRQEAFAGQRVAVNLAGVDKEQIERGHVLATPGSIKSTQRLDVEITLLDELDFNLKQRGPIRLHMATSDVLGRIIFFDRNECLPGETCLAQLELEEPVAALFEDRFVLRRPTPMTTIGGGIVIDPYAPKHRFGPQTIELISSKKEKDVGSRAAYLLNQTAILTLDQLLHQLGVSREEWESAVEDPAQYDLKRIEDPQRAIILYTTEEQWVAIWGEIGRKLRQYHQKHPLRDGLDRKRIQQEFFPQLNTAQWNLVLNTAATEGKVRIDHEVLADPHFEAVLSPQLEKIWQGVLIKMDQLGLEVPPWSELMPADLNEEEQLDLQQWLIRRGELLPLEDGRHISRQTFENAVRKLKEETGPSFTLQEAKDVYNTSRKYLIPFLETLDKLGYTVRQDSKRVWRQKKSDSV